MNGQHNTKEILFSLLLILIWKKLKIEVPSFLGKRVPSSFYQCRFRSQDPWKASASFLSGFYLFNAGLSEGGVFPVLLLTGNEGLLLSGQYISCKAFGPLTQNLIQVCNRMSVRYQILCLR